MVTAIKCNDYLNHVDVGDLVHNRDLMVHTSVYYGPHPCVLWSTPLCTMVHTPVYYGPHPCVLWSTPGPHPCVLWSTPLCTMVHTPEYYGPHPCVLWSTPLCTMVHTPVYYGGGEGEGRGEVHPGLGEGIWGSTNPPPPPHPCVL